MATLDQIKDLLKGEISPDLLVFTMSVISKNFLYNSFSSLFGALFVQQVWRNNRVGISNNRQGLLISLKKLLQPGAHE